MNDFYCHKTSEKLSDGLINPFSTPSDSCRSLADFRYSECNYISHFVFSLHHLWQWFLNAVNRFPSTFQAVWNGRSMTAFKISGQVSLFPWFNFINWINFLSPVCLILISEVGQSTAGVQGGWEWNHPVIRQLQWSLMTIEINHKLNE